MVRTLEEAILYAEEVAEKNNKIADTFEYSLKTKSDCKECAEEYRQLVGWLKELKAYKEAEEAINRKMKSGQWSDVVVFGMGKALAIIHKYIREVNANE